MMFNADNVFNSVIAASAISAAYELEIFEILESHEIFYLENFCTEKELHKESVKAIVDALCCFKILEFTPELQIVRQGESFQSVVLYKGYFLWLIRGYGYCLQNLASLCKIENRGDDFLKRDGKYIAIAGRDYGKNFVDSYFDRIIENISFNTVVDLGCGSAERLVSLAKKYPGMRGIGIDINPEAVKVALSNVNSASVQDRIFMIEGDLKNLERRPEFEEVDLMFSFFNGHDTWPYDSCLKTMQSLRRIFPNVKRFLLCDTYRSNLIPSHKVPIFTLGFEFTHAVMGQYIPLQSEWMKLFLESGWICVNCREIGIPFSAIFELAPNH
jgi:phenylpyruvate C(3)-methyltransferase